jgi:acyl-CoA thioesterase
MHIDKLLALAKTQKTSPNLVLTIPSSWSQGRTVYGGLSAGLLYAAAREYVPLERVMRSNSTNFVGPLIANQPFTITVEILREGKNVSQLMVRAIQDNKICVVSQICFGNNRESAISVPNKETHNIASPINEVITFSGADIKPEFLKHIDLSIQEGGFPFSSQNTSHYCGWMRFKKAPATFTDAHLISIIDAWPPTLIQMLSAPAPESSVSWSLEFIYPHRSISGNDWLAYKVHTRQAGHGYGHTEANIWDKDGQLIAISRQTVAIFD